MLVVLVVCLASGLAQAQEYIVTEGRLSDTDFYRLVSCAAYPGQGCNEAVVRWNKPAVTVTFSPIPAAYPVELGREMDAALDFAITQINAAAPRLNLRRVSKSVPADINIYLQAIVAGDAIRRTGEPDLDGLPIGAAQVQIWWDETLSLTDAVIVFASDIPSDQVRSVMLEEMSQAMGLMTDIRNPYYETRSVFSEDSNSVSKLGEQDREALRRHYANR